jgi:TetR/AcrR family transcriptional regulator
MELLPTNFFSLKPIMSQDQKREAIIEAALKRFAHFGVAKTTMSEIGADLSISKALLYYYFPDKITLYAAVLKSIIDKSEATSGPVVDAQPDPFKAIQLFLEHRTQFIIKYYNILEFLRTKQGIPDELKPLFGQLRERELRRIQSIVDKGVSAGLLHPDNAQAKATLLFECLEGLRYVYLGQPSSFFPEKEQFLNLSKREKELSQTFLKGLTT